MSKARELADLGNVTTRLEEVGNTDGALSNRNLIINGAMQVAQRGTSFTADNVYTLDRWKSGDGTGGTPARTTTQETFALGQTDVPGFHYYLRHDQTGASTNGNSSLVQKIEDVTRFDGQTVTLSFYAKANATMNADVRLIQEFGTGGSPSSNVTVTETVSIGTSWTRYTVTKTLGSLSGKTLGTDGIHTSSLTLDIEFKPTSTFTFDITGIQLEVGDTATPFEHRSYGQELALCQRYFYRLPCDNAFSNAEVENTTGARGVIQFPTSMRTGPSMSYLSVGDFALRSGGAGYTLTSLTLGYTTTDNFRFNAGVASGLTAGRAGYLYGGLGDSINFDAEL